LDVYNAPGTIHDFRMFKESAAEILPGNITALLDSDQGADEYQKNAVIPVKSTKKHELTD